MSLDCIQNITDYADQNTADYCRVEYANVQKIHVEIRHVYIHQYNLSSHFHRL